MKRMFGLLAAVLVIASCAPSQPATTPASGDAGTVVPAPDLSAAKDNQAWVIYHDLAMWKDGEAKLKWIGSLAIGDKVELLGATGEFVAEGSNDKRDYVKIRFGDKEAWVRDIFLSQGGSMGLLANDKAKVYSEPRAIKVSAKVLNGPGVLGIAEEKDGYLKVRYYDYTAKVLFDGDTWVQKSDVAMSEADVTAGTLWVAANLATKKDIKINLLSTAAEQFGQSALAGRIQADLAALQEVKPVATEVTDQTFLVNDNKVNVRDMPGVDGKVLDTLGKDTQVKAFEKTSEAQTINGVTAPWFRLVEPEGWVFGAFLDPVQ